VSEKFIQQHTDEQGNPDSTLLFNRISPPFFVGGALLLAVYFCAVRGRKVVAEDDTLVVAGKVKIRGYFIVTYKNESGKEVRRKLTDRSYDNLGPLLEHLVAQIT